MSHENTVNFKQTSLKSIPNGWEVVRLVDYCDFIRGTEPGSKSYNREKKGAPFIRVGNVSAQIQELLYITSERIRLCSENDILLTLDGSPGVVIKGYEGAYSSGIRKVIPKNENVDKLYIYFILQTDLVQKIISKYTTGVTIKHAGKSLEHIIILLPPLPEQQKIAYILSTVDKKIEVEEKRKSTLRELFKTMLHKLMTGEIRLKDTEV